MHLVTQINTVCDGSLTGDTLLDVRDLTVAYLLLSLAMVAHVEASISSTRGGQRVISTLRTCKWAWS